jgi:RNA polymerase sigma factor (TIGR02999 family)
LPEDSRQVVSATLENVSAGRSPRNVPDQLLPIVYGELRRLAGAYLKREPSGHTLQPTELVHEAYLKLVDQTRVDWHGRTHFFAVAATAMRRILVDHARQKSRQKRGGDRRRVTLNEEICGVRPDCELEDLLALDDALIELAGHDARQAQIVEMRAFADLKVSEVAEVLGVSKRTIEGEWAHAVAWLKRRLASGASS